ncbi:hypothetical protein ABZ330_33105 [Streptomyces sp. NPDC006172]|uniref:hypothetical protein n=1 Tax=Streptomyces sp. NPDC006172 TaxID=3154470 RepID=UPI0033CD3908
MNHHLDDQGPDGLDSDELALRRMLHQAVQEMEPRDGTLDHLRRAVPVRRARKRQAVIGIAAAAVFVVTAVPAALHVSNSDGSDANPAIAGQASKTQDDDGASKLPDGGASGTAHAADGSPGQKDEDPGKGDEKDKETGSATGATTGAGPSSSGEATVPACTASQLGAATAGVDAPDATGVVYGGFHVVNVSDHGCTVGGAVSLTSTAQGAADPAKISVVEYAAGGQAAQLPGPSRYASGLTLAPGAAYDVRFAWVPAETCPTPGGGTGGDTGGGGTASPDPSPSEQNSGTASAGAGEGTAPQLLVEDGTADGSVVVTYTAEGGGPTVSATVTNACAGTVYRTGVLASF